MLLSGRWFRAARASGPWTFVRADQLPAAFKNVPAASDIGGVRVSVAGTEEAEDAMLDSAIPQTQNTPTQVLEIASHYCAVDNGVWFVSPSAMGPWARGAEGRLRHF